MQNTPTPLFADIPHAALDARAGARYRYWHGRSGRRHLATLIKADEARSFDRAVLLIVREGMVAWAGSAGTWREDLLRPGDRVYVHLLARTTGERADVIADFGVCDEEEALAA